MASSPFKSVSGWLLFLHGFLVSITVRADPVPTSVQYDPHFIGWFIGPTTTQALTDPDFWSTTGSYARGCSTNPCSVATDCQSNSITYDNGKTSTCNVCRTMTIYESAPFKGPTASNIFCAEHWSAFQVYRKLPEPTTTPEAEESSTKSKPQPASPASTTSTTKETAKPTEDKPTEDKPTKTKSTEPSPSEASPTAAKPTSTEDKPTDDPPNSKPDPSPPSQAWIAGAVAGPIAGIAFFAGIVVWVIYRRKHRRDRVAWPHDHPYMGPPVMKQQQQFPYEMSAPGLKQPQQFPYEMDPTGRRPSVYELSSGNQH
ncbi:uncharacterized protein BDW47DRAFT_102376 [Aspergillus candidus]|uniref:Mid2 domain-containing protein n=1 Tax=Aspergillus candidus TaxID=41067 RepID=A0A2I2FGN3_ASPCN|nr:hypothetical protein BDW47DRAFT_102376 [Aspergillus candidus]PLB39769.1 hypothetical protein BDW47DRAFT_102376 [Aspergillus candidus]